MPKNRAQLIAGLDIGSDAVRLAVGQLTASETKGAKAELQILGAAETPSAGIHKGSINSIEDVVSSISACLERTERMVGVPVESVWVGVSGLHVMAQKSKGIVAVSKADNEISEQDVNRALDAARSISVPLNYEVLHVIPKNFNVDGQMSIRDPIGMTGIRLEVDAQIILGASTQIKNLTKAIYRAGLEIEDLVLSILATGESVLTDRQKDLGVAVVDLGGATTSVAVYEEGDLLHTAVLPVGSDHITNDVAIGLRTTIDVAEKVKLEYGDCFAERVSKKDDIDLGGLGAPDHELVKKHYVSDIIEARVEEILYKVDNEFKQIGRSGLLPAGVIFTGGGARLAGLVEIAKKQLRLPATLGYPYNVFSVTDKVNDLGFATAIGLVKWGYVMAGAPSGKYHDKHAGPGALGAATGKLRHWFNTLIP